MYDSYITQYQLKNMDKLLQQGKAIIIYGPRRCGKTTLLKEFSKKLGINKKKNNLSTLLQQGN